MNIVYGIGVVLGLLTVGGEHSVLSVQIMVSGGGLLLTGLSALAFLRS